MIKVYMKMSDEVSLFKEALDALPKDKIVLVTESLRSFKQLDSMDFSDGDILVMARPMGKERIKKWLKLNIIVIFCSHPATYEYGLSLQLNHAVLAAIAQTQAKQNTLGRPKLDFPDDWDELYEKWLGKEITSSEFIEKSGLKKASFYNMLSEYKEILREREKFLEEYA